MDQLTTKTYPDQPSGSPSDLFDVGLTDAERERLALLMEECAEVQQAIGKILRHGYQSTNPQGTAQTNRELLECELGDLKAALLIATHNGDLGSVEIDVAMMRKLSKIPRWLHFQTAIPPGNGATATPHEGLTACAADKER